MRLGIMQPYFFPYVGHFSLIDATDEWVVFDTSQYTPKGWMNRNRLQHPKGGSTWMTVPLANSSIHIAAHQARLLDPARARRSILGQLTHYCRAPFYRAVVAMVAGVFRDEDLSLAALNLRSLAAVCAYLGMDFRARCCSEMMLELPPCLPPGEWAPQIAAACGATAYVNPIGGRALFNESNFQRRGLALSFLRADPFAYETGSMPFQPNLSVLDALMWNDPARVLAAVRNYRLLTPGDLDG